MLLVTRFAFVVLFCSTLAFVPAPAEGAARQSYIVEPDLSLGLIALKLYGSGRMASEIAGWNHLKKPYRVFPGQNLILKKQPLFSPVEGDLLIKNFYLKILDLREEKTELGNSSEPVSSPQVKQEKFQEALQKITEENEKDLSKEELSANHFQTAGEESFKAGKYEEALLSFRKSRELEDEPLAPWFYEIRTLKFLHRDNDAKSTAIIFAKRHPEVKNFPVLKPYLENQ